jgi:hypothetical protein
MREPLRWIGLLGKENLDEAEIREVEKVGEKKEAERWSRML